MYHLATTWIKLGADFLALLYLHFQTFLWTHSSKKCSKSLCKFQLWVLKGRRLKLLSGFFCAKGVPPPPTHLAEIHFAKKKPLAEMGVTPPP